MELEDEAVVNRSAPAIAPCTDVGIERNGDVTNSGAAIQENDVVIVYENLNSVRSVVVEAGKTTQTRYGVFRHNDWIGRSYGCKVFDKKKKVGEWWCSRRRSMSEELTK